MGNEALNEKEVGTVPNRQRLPSRELWVGGSFQGYSRDVAGDVREVIGRCHNQPQVPLLGFCGNIVDDVASPGLNIVRLEVSHCRNVGVSGLAVVTLVVVV